MLLIGWSVIEGLGAAMIIPAIAALAAGNYDGRDRAVAFGVIGGIAAAGAAAGPIIGGFVATEWTWRLVFAGEVVIMAVLLVASGVIKDAPRPERRAEARRGRRGAVGRRAWAWRCSESSRAPTGAGSSRRER